jgi:hypothetical protein
VGARCFLAHASLEGRGGSIAHARACSRPSKPAIGGVAMTAAIDHESALAREPCPASGLPVIVSKMLRGRSSHASMCAAIQRGARAGRACAAGEVRVVLVGRVGARAREPIGTRHAARNGEVLRARARCGSRRGRRVATIHVDVARSRRFAAYEGPVACLGGRLPDHATVRDRSSRT